MLGFLSRSWERRKQIRGIPPSDEEEPPVPDRELRCILCDGDMLFEVPPCPDGHDECPELVCTRCGAAEVLMPVTLHVWSHPKGRIAPLQRRAA
jgi:hypothetical protein